MREMISKTRIWFVAALTMTVGTTQQVHAQKLDWQIDSYGFFDNTEGDNTYRKDMTHFGLWVAPQLSVKRENLNPIEEAKAFHRLITEFNLKQDEVAERVSKSRVAITNSMRLLKLSDEVQQMIIDGKLTSGHARALISVEDKKLQLELAEKIFDEKLSVRQAEKLVKDLGKEKPASKQPVVIDKNLENIYRDLEKRCKEKTGTKVAITPKGNNGGGKIEIEFYNNDDLEKITRMLLI